MPSDKSLCAAVFVHNGVTYRVSVRKHPGLTFLADRAAASPRHRTTEAGGAIVIEALDKPATPEKTAT